MSISARIALATSFAVLSGCATGPWRWVDPAIPPTPPRLSVYVDEFDVHNPSDMKDDLQMDAAAFKQFFKGILADSLRSRAGIQQIDWLDTMQVKTDTILVGFKKERLKKPAPGTVEGWALSLTAPSTWRFNESTGLIPKMYLEVLSYYVLSEGATGKVLAYGRMECWSKFGLTMEKKNWNEATQCLAGGFGDVLSTRRTPSVPDSTSKPSSATAPTP